jgi:sporulation protein YabP
MHNLVLEERKRLSLTGVREVGSFDAKAILFYLQAEEMLISGKDLRITEINTETGEALVEGEIRAVIYSDGSKSFISDALGKIFNVLSQKT